MSTTISLLATARDAERSAPAGVSRSEGRIAIGLGVVEIVTLAVLFQAHNIAGGGLVLWAALLVWVVAIMAGTRMMARRRRVWPRGISRGFTAARLWTAVFLAVGGWCWLAQGPHAATPSLTTLVAVVAVVPWLVVSVRLARMGARVAPLSATDR